MVGGFAVPAAIRAVADLHRPTVNWCRRPMPDGHSPLKRLFNFSIRRSDGSTCRSEDSSVSLFYIDRSQARRVAVRTSIDAAVNRSSDQSSSDKEESKR